MDNEELLKALADKHGETLLSMYTVPGYEPEDKMYREFLRGIAVGILRSIQIIAGHRYATKVERCNRRDRVRRMEENQQGGK